jgi:Rrf2 family protein
MAGSSRFIVAVHVLTLLAHDGRALTSEYVAGSVNTNPVSVRRVLGLLTKAGLVTTTEGAGGGAALARPAGKITLADVYRAVEEEGDIFGTPRSAPNPMCPVGGCVQSIVRQTYVRSFETAMQREMEQQTLADVLADVRKAIMKR